MSCEISAHKPSFREFLNQRRAAELPIFFDGGMGTMIQKTGVVGYTIPEDLNFYHPEIIIDIHRQYLAAGSHVLTANSFGANPLKMEGCAHTAEEYIAKAVVLEKSAVARAEAEGFHGPHYISWDTGQIGKLLEPMGPLTFDQAYESYRTAAISAEQAGAELAIIETMSDLYEVKAAVLAIKEHTHLPIVATMTFQSNLRTLTGADVLTCVTYLEALKVDVIGFNCGGSLEEDLELAKQFCRYAHLPVLMQPNAGLPVVENGRTIFKVPPQIFAAAQVQNRIAGAMLLGGCCGTTPDHIQHMVEEINTKTVPLPDSAKPSHIAGYAATDTFVCSYNHAVQIGGMAGPVIIGERINPTGKKKCREALLSGNMDFVRDEAESQINAGAHLLDVNVGLPGLNEAETMVLAVKTIQDTFNTPLQIDSSDPAVLEKALRYYNGKALVNSTNGKQEVMDKVFPLVAHYGGAIVALCIDEDGIAPTAEGRVSVAKKIIREAASYGIPVRDIFIDTLTLTVSSEQDSALETIKAISALNSEYGAEGLRFVLGVSNISFGLPRRDLINSRFFMLALQAGLSACIINPASQSMMDTFRSYRALAGFDKNCLDFIHAYTGTIDPTTAKAKEAILTQAVKDGTISIAINARPIASSEYSPPTKNTETVSAEKNNAASIPSVSADEAELISIIEKGFKDKAVQATEKLLSSTEPVAIIDRCIVPALDSVGKDFEAGKKFLPQLLLSADTVSASFCAIKHAMAANGKTGRSKGTVVIATVFGDIHDIGKNIVKAMLENYGYTVIDLGKNVPPQTVIDTVIEQDIKLVGLSALMTTTVAHMEETITLLRAALEKAHRLCKIMVGGAVLTPDYAKKIGADYYAKDAMQSVAIAKEVFGQ